MQSYLKSPAQLELATAVLSVTNWQIDSGGLIVAVNLWMPGDNNRIEVNGGWV